MSAIKVEKTEVFDKWFSKLRDRRARSVIDKHINRIANGNVGVVGILGGGVFEKKINYGPGYRLYFADKDRHWIILLCGGDKSTQERDIELAHKLKKEVM
jgi:putative addiction module killer protein